MGGSGGGGLGSVGGIGGIGGCGGLGGSTARGAACHYGRLVAATLPGHAPGQRAQEQQVGKHRERDGAAPAWGWGGSELIAIVVGVHAAQKYRSVGRLSRLA